MAPTASTSRLADSPSSSDEEAKARRKKERKQARKAARLKEQEEEEREAEAQAKARKEAKAARKQSDKSAKKDKEKKKRVIPDSEEEDDDDVELVVVHEKRRPDDEARKLKKAKLTTSKEASGSTKKEKSTKERGRPPAASKADDSSSEEESLAVASKRKASLSREQSRERSHSRANSQERSATTTKPALKRVPSTSASTSNPKPSSSSSSKQGSKPSTFLAPSSTTTANKSKPAPTASRPSLHVDTTKSRSPRNRDSALSPPLSPNKSLLTATSTSSTSRKLPTTSTHPTTNSSPLPPPLRLRHPSTSRSKDMPFPLPLSLNFTILLPNRKGVPETLPARIENLAEATAFLEFALARGRMGSWTGIEVRRERKEGGKGAWEVSIALVEQGGRGKTIVEVTASASAASAASAAAGGKSMLGRPASEKEREADQAELGGKLEIIRALVRPSEAEEGFLKEIDPQLVEPLVGAGRGGEIGFADDDDEDGEGDTAMSGPTKGGEDIAEAMRRRDEQSRLLFQTFKTVHPRRQLGSIERRLKSIGDLEFEETCKELVEVIKKGTVDLGEGVKLGFGRWVGDVATNLKASLGHIHRFCMLPHHAYLDFSIQILTTLLDLCIATNGGPEAEEWINTWLHRLEKDNEQVEADYKRRGVPKPTIKSIPVAPKRIPAPAPAPAPPPPAIISPPPPATTTTAPPPVPEFALPVAEPRQNLSPKRTRQDEPSLDPRAAAKRRRMEEGSLTESSAAPQPQPQPQPLVVETAVAPEAQFVESPQAIVPLSSSYAARPSASPAPTLPASSAVAEAPPPLARSPLEIKTEAVTMASSLHRLTATSPAPGSNRPFQASGTRASPIVVARASPTRAITRASPSIAPQTRATLTRATSITRATSTGLAPSSSSLRTSATSHPPHSRPASSLVGNSDSSRSKGHQAPTPEPTPEAEARGGKETVLYEREAVLLEGLPIPDGRSLLAFGFEVVDVNVVERLHESLYHDNSMTKARLPLRARAVFRRTIEDSSTWPSISINVNGSLIPLANSSLAAGNLITALHSFEITRLVQQGGNTLNLARWKTDHLPPDLHLSIELYRAVSEEWFRAQLKDDERTYDLYDERARVPAPVGVSILDPITGVRIVTPVRGAKCEHLETFDLDGYLELNRQQELGDWLCPHSSCRAYAPPTSLAICSWHADALKSVEADINILDIVRSEQAEEVKPVVKGEQQ